MRPQQEHFQTLIMPDALIPQKSTSGGIQFLGDKLVSWMSKKQNCTAMSSARHRGALPLQVCAQDYENQSYDPTRTEDLPKDNLKVRKCILSIEALKNEKEMSMDKGSKIEPSKPLTQKRVQYRCGKVTHLFASMLVQPTEDEGATSERPFEPQPTPSPPHPSKANVEPQSDPSPRPSPSTHIPNSIPDISGGNHGDQSSSYRSSQGNKTLEGTDQEAKEESQTCYYTPQSLDEECILEAKIGRKEILEEKLDAKGVYAQDVGRTRDVVNKEKKTADDKVSTEDALSTSQQKVYTDKEKVSTDRPKVNTDKEDNSTVSPDEGTDDRTEGRSATPTTPTTTPTMFGDDETIAQTERPRPTLTRSLLTLKPLPKIDPKDKGKKKIEEEDKSDTESEGIPKDEKKFKQLARDEEMAIKVQEDWEAEEEVKNLAEEEAIKAALSNEYDFIQARMEADRLLALRLQDEEREKFTVEERAKFLHDTIAAQRRFLAEQRAIAIRNRPPTRTQLRNQMMTYLKHVGNKKHSDLKNKTFEEIQALYEKVKRFDESFTAVGSTEDERRIKEMNEGVKDPDQKSLKKRVVEETPKKEDTTKVPAKVDVTEQGTKKRKGGHMKMLARKRKRSQSDVDSNDEHRKCLKIITFKGTMNSEILERKFVIARLNKVISPDGNYLVIYKANGNFRAFNSLLEDDQQDWEIVTWRLYQSCGAYILELKDGTFIHMLVERRYHFSKDLLQRMLDLGLEVERESTATLDLIKFIKQQIDEN
ncbi:hypothetical protein Tco_0762760 [Tanacetum coccineum]